MDISLIIPAYNEAGRIGASLEKAFAHLQGLGRSFEVIVVDDGSSDRTARIVRGHARPELKLIELGRNRGKGAAVRAGMLAATGDYRVFTDADLSTPLTELPALLGELKDGADVCIGSRGIDRGRIRVHQPWYRETMGRVFNLLVRRLVLDGISDTQCGFKGFTARAAERLFPLMKTDGFSFDVELILLARRHGFRIREIPVEWYNSALSRVNPLRDSARMFRDLIRIRWTAAPARHGPPPAPRKEAEPRPAGEGAPGREQACNLCGGLDHRQVYPRSAARRPLRHTPAGYTISASTFEKPERLLRCRGCGLIFAALDPGEHHRLRRDYHEMEDPAYLMEEDGRRRQARIILDRIPLSGTRRLLDIGCGPGIFLDEARRRGWDVNGVELSAWACAHAQRTYGIRILQGTLAEAAFPDASFDAIVMNDVLEHLDDPRGTLAEMRRILKDDGVVYLSTIDIESLLSRLLGGWWWGINRHHLYYFSRRTLELMFREVGFRSLSYLPYPRVFSFGYWARRLEGYPFLLSGPFRALAGLGGMGRRMLRIDLRDQIWVAARKTGA